MKLLSKDEAKSICDKVMAMSKADECRVNLSGSRKGNVRYANNSGKFDDWDVQGTDGPRSALYSITTTRGA